MSFAASSCAADGIRWRRSAGSRLPRLRSTARPRSPSRGDEWPLESFARHWRTSRRFGCSFRRKASRSVRTCSMRHAESVDERLGWPNPDTKSPQSIRTRSESRRQRNGSPLQLPIASTSAVPRDAMPGLPAGTRFDAILCLDHALGRGSTADDVAFLRRLEAHARPGGKLILDFLNRDFFASRPRPFAFHTIGSLEQHEFRSFDPVTSALRLEWKFYERVGENLKHRTDSSAEVILLTPRDLAAILGQSGWRMVGVWGGWHREAVTADHRQLIVLATPAG